MQEVLHSIKSDDDFSGGGDIFVWVFDKGQRTPDLQNTYLNTGSLIFHHHSADVYTFSLILM